MAYGIIGRLQRSYFCNIDICVSCIVCSWTVSLFLRDDQVKRQTAESRKALESSKEVISSLSNERDDLRRR